jgi:hypothetical protein
MWTDAGHRGIKKARIAAVGGYIYSRTFYWMQSGLKSKSLQGVVVLIKDATTYHRLIKMSKYQNRTYRSRLILARVQFFTLS